MPSSVSTIEQCSLPSFIKLDVLAKPARNKIYFPAVTFFIPRKAKIVQYRTVVVLNTLTFVMIEIVPTYDSLCVGVILLPIEVQFIGIAINS